MESHSKQGKRKKKIIITLAVVLTIVLTSLIFFLITTFNTQIIIGLIQRLSLNASGQERINSFEPISETVSKELDNGNYLITNIKYDDEYPNSYFDITYQTGEKDSSLPTLIYFHGGGFFFGSKSSGDPLAGSSSYYHLDKMIEAGYNLVNVDYGLVPACRFPIPLIQMNRLFAYLNEHCEELDINMDEVVLMGQSAGAIMVSQYGAIISNTEYAKLLSIEPTLNTAQVSCLIIDDAPLDYKKFSLSTKYIIGNYVKGSIYLSKDEIYKYNMIDHVTENYPRTFLLGSDEYGSDMQKLKVQLDNHNVSNGFVYPLLEGINTSHCFIGGMEYDEVAKDAFQKMMEFLQTE